MAFCTKCGRQLADGEVCDCQNETKVQEQQVQPQEQEFNPYAEQSPEFETAANNDDIVISIDKDKVKQGFSDAASKLQSGVVKGVGMINDSKEKAENSSIYETDMLIVPDCISANDGEVHIKQYKFAKLRTRILFEKSYGRLQITNKRIIFRAAGRSLFGKNILQEEFGIDQIAGVEIRCKKEFNFLNLLFGIILTALFGGLSYLISSNMDNVPAALVVIFGLFVLIGCGILSFLHIRGEISNGLFPLRQILLAFATGAYPALFWDDNGFIYFCAGFMAVACLVNLFLCCIVENLVAVFKTGAASAIEIKREPVNGLLYFLIGQKDDSATGFREVISWKDTDLAIREVGTIIDDIKTMGDAAIEKWKQD